MSAFSLIPRGFQLALAGAASMAAVAVLLLCVCLYLYEGRIKKCLPEGVLFILLWIMASLLATADAPQKALRIAVPWAICAACVLLSFGYAVWRLLRLVQKHKNAITPASVKQALDNLNMGVLFADDVGRTVLVNHKMAEICLLLSGAYPQTAVQLQAAFDRAEQPEADGALFRLPDGTVWRLKTEALTAPSLKGYVQITAQDVTELYRANCRLEEQNEALRLTNDQMQVMLERLSDRIRAQETLALKTQIHDDIGTGLIALSRLMNSGEEADVEAELESLRTALGYFSANRVKPENTLEAVTQAARKMGVVLKVSGDYSAVEGLAAAAARECVTNCVNHAGGDTVFVTVAPQDGGTVITVTNNGRAPDAPIKEGGGLTNLRRQAENAGAVMKITHIPTFILTITVGDSYDSNHYC